MVYLRDIVTGLVDEFGRDAIRDLFREANDKLRKGEIDNHDGNSRGCILLHYVHNKCQFLRLQDAVRSYHNH